MKSEHFRYQNVSIVRFHFVPFSLYRQPPLDDLKGSQTEHEYWRLFLQKI